MISTFFFFLKMMISTCLNIEKSDFSCQYVCCVGLNPGA